MRLQTFTPHRRFRSYSIDLERPHRSDAQMTALSIRAQSGSGADLVASPPAARFRGLWLQTRDPVVRGRQTRAGDNVCLGPSRHLPCKSPAAPLDHLFTPR